MDVVNIIQFISSTMDGCKVNIIQFIIKYDGCKVNIIQFIVYIKYDGCKVNIIQFISSTMDVK